MAFIVSKISRFGDKARRLYYLVSNYREGNKVRRKAILSLEESKNLSEKLQKTIEQEKKALLECSELENRLERVKRGDFTAYLMYCPPYRQVARITEYINDLRSELEKHKSDKVKIEALIKQYPNCSANKPIKHLGFFGTTK